MREKDNPSLEMTPNIDQIVQDTFQLRESCFSDHCQLHCDWPRLHSGSASSSGSSGEDVDGLPVYGGQARSQRIPPFIGRHQRPRPQITLRYTQTIDGSLVASDAEPLQIDDPYSTQLINRLRANSDAILVGINTIIRDDPSMASPCPKQPQLVILDTDLKMPLAARILQHWKKPWVFAKAGLEDDPRREELIRAGLRVFHVPQTSTGLLDIEEILEKLYLELEIRKLTVEGGVRVLETFIKSELFDKVLVIISPSYGAGRALFQNQTLSRALPRLVDVRYEAFGRNLIMMAEPEVPLPPSSILDSM